MTTQAQLDAILHGAAFAPITDRAFLRVTGADATRWLNGMVTNNIKDLAPGEGNYNFLLNAQGRIQGDCTIYRESGEPPTYLLETGNSQLETVRQTLDRFIIMDDVELSRISTSGLLIVGNKAYEMLCDAQLPPTVRPGEKPQPSPLLGHMHWSALLGRKSWTVQPPSMADRLHYEFWSPEPSDVTELRTKLLLLDAVEVSPETLESLRILEGRPKYGTDIRNTDTHKDLPQETAQTHALHFAKGCYLGQEIVERIRSRGQVHRIFTQFRLTGTLPNLPAPLEANGKPAGELTSAIQIGDDLIALGYARREALETHQTLTYPGGTAAQTHISNLTSHI